MSIWAGERVLVYSQQKDCPGAARSRETPVSHNKRKKTGVRALVRDNVGSISVMHAIFDARIDQIWDTLMNECDLHAARCAPGPQVATWPRLRRRREP